MEKKESGLAAAYEREVEAAQRGAVCYGRVLCSALERHPGLHCWLRLPLAGELKQRSGKDRDRDKDGVEESRGRDAATGGEEASGNKGKGRPTEGRSSEGGTGAQVEQEEEKKQKGQNQGKKKKKNKKKKKHVKGKKDPESEGDPQQPVQGARKRKGGHGSGEGGEEGGRGDDVVSVLRQAARMGGQRDWTEQGKEGYRTGEEEKEEERKEKEDDKEGQQQQHLYCSVHEQKRPYELCDAVRTS